HRGEIHTRVAIVGGGLTGCACAASFAAAGVDVVLLEADRIGAGATAGSGGLLRQGLDASFPETGAPHRPPAARPVRQGLLPAALRRFGVRADLVSQDLVFMTRDGGEAARRLQREYHARRDADVEASWLNARAAAAETGIIASGAIKTRGEALDPYRASVGLAAVAAARGASIHERSVARRIRAGRKAVEIGADGGGITAA